jgi:hypothetical protein
LAVSAIRQVHGQFCDNYGWSGQEPLAGEILTLQAANWAAW